MKHGNRMCIYSIEHNPRVRWAAALLVVLAFLPLSLYQPTVVHASTMNVSITTDVLNSNDLECSLREAIIRANTNSIGLAGECPLGSDTQTDTIRLENGETYTLTLAGDDNTAFQGDLDIVDNTVDLDLVITTADPAGAPAVIDASGIAGGDRVLQIFQGANVELENITITGGSATGNGGGIYTAGTLALNNVTVTSNSVTNGNGGGIYNAGIFINVEGIITNSTLALNNVTVTSNSVAGGSGGGIYNNIGATLTMQASTVSLNLVAEDGGGIYNAGTAVIEDETLIGTLSGVGANAAEDDGGGIYNAVDATMTINDSTVSSNRTSPFGNNPNAGGAGVYNEGQITINNTQIASNVTSNGNGSRGGGIFNRGNLEMNGGTIAENETGSGNQADGAGIANGNNGTATLDGVQVLMNQTGDGDSSGGAGIWNTAEINVTDSLIQGNRSGNGVGSSGGGIATDDTMTLATSIVQDNSTGNGDTSRGGGIAHFGGSLDIATSQIIGNATGTGSGSVGGGIWNDNGALLTITDSTLENNSTGDSNGGGIFNSGQVELTTSTLMGNQAGGTDQDGGGIYNAATGSVTLVASTLHDNRTSDSGNAADGGGIFNLGTLDLLNSTVSGNTARTIGGGVYTGSGSEARITASTIVNNVVVNGTAGGLWVDNLVSSADLRSTIIAGNTANFNPDCEDVVGTMTSQGYNLIGIGDGCGTVVNGVSDDQVGTAGSPLDAGVEALSDNGGPTLTHALLLTSPAIDAIPAAACVDQDSAPILTDQRGASRPTGPGCDIGSFEYTDDVPNSPTEGFTLYLPLIRR